MFGTLSHKGDWHAVIFSDMDGTGDDHIEENRLSTERQIEYGLVLVGHEKSSSTGSSEWSDGYQMGEWEKRMRKSSCYSSMTFRSPGLLYTAEKVLFIVS